MADTTSTTVQDAKHVQEPAAEGPSADVSDNEAPTAEPEEVSRDYSDVASVDSENPTASRRRHQRGGRRGRRKPERKLQSASESDSHIANQSQDQATHTETDSKAGSHPGDYDDEELNKARSSRTSGARKIKSPGKSRRRDTGIRGFSIRRGEGPGGRPVGVTIERPKVPGKTKGKQKGKAAKDPEKEPDKETEPGHKEQEGNEVEEQYEDEDEEPETETEHRKPVSIRFDLNLEVEICVRMKIQGDVTVTFLD